jgi:hypothetical protein
MNCPECHKHRDYKLCKVCNLCTNCCNCEETPIEKELLTPEFIDGWKRCATYQIQNKREKITIPTTLLLAMIHKIENNKEPTNDTD